MTRKDFNELARIVRFYMEDDKADRETVERMALQLAEFCKERNPRFDRQRFYDACGMETPVTGFFRGTL